MQILNSKDRNQAFLKFLLFFIITALLLISAVYYNFSVPEKENDWLRSQLDVQRNQEANQDKFVSKMEEALLLFGEMDKKDANLDLLNNKLNKIIGDMQDLEQNEKTLYGKMNKAIVAKFDELKRAKKEIVETKGNADRIDGLEKQINDCKRELEIVNKSLDDYRNSDQ